MTLVSEVVVVGQAWQYVDPNVFASISSTYSVSYSPMEALAAAASQSLASGGSYREMGGVVAPEVPFVIPDKTLKGRVIDSQFFKDLIEHFNQLPTIAHKIAEFKAIYTDQNHDFYIDFDQYPSSYDVTYYSAAEGAVVTDSVYAAGSNFIYGSIGRLVGIPKEVLRFAADYTQAGQQDVFFLFRTDHPHDAINVSVGIYTAEAYLGQGRDPLDFFQAEPQLSSIGTGTADGIEGTAVGDDLRGSFGDDRLHGAGGGDSLYGDDGADMVFGGAGLDNLFGGPGNDGISGGLDDDVIFGQSGDDVLFGDQGTDWIEGGDGNDIIHGGAGDDRYAFVSGGMLGGAGNDAITGGDGHDQAHGGDGNDTLLGGAGDDLLIGDDASVQWYSSGGYLTVSVGPHSGFGHDTLYGHEGNDSMFGGSGDDYLHGGPGSDSLHGGAGNDTLAGGQDADVLAGGQGDDLIIGDLQNDTLTGDRGNDGLYGKGGADIFLTNADTGIDRVYDFNSSEGDRVHVQYGAYSVYQSGLDAVVDFGSGSQLILVGVQTSGLGAGWIF